MENLFKKALVFTDIHFGRNGNNPVANLDNLDFIDWAIEVGKTRGAETLIFMGDWHDNRHSLHLSTMAYSLDGIDRLHNAFEKIHWLPGNHDLLYRDNRSVSSIEFNRHLSKINIIRDPMSMGNVTFLPWLVGNEYKTAGNFSSRYVFGHLEVAGFLMNERVAMADTPHALKPDSFLPEHEFVFTGHFHWRQVTDKVVYTGNVMPFNFSDANDTNRGLMMLEWGKDPEFIRWDDQPLYFNMKLSELATNPSALPPKSTARVTIDLPISYEEASVIREHLCSTQGVRKIELVHQHNGVSDDTHADNLDTQHKTVDQIVIEGINTIESKEISPEKMIEIYRSLPSL